MNKEFITYHQAKNLVDMGFIDIPRFGYQASLYDKNGDHIFYANYGVMGSGLDEGYIYAPLKSTVFRWFREKGYAFSIYFDISENDQYMIDVFEKDYENNWWKFCYESPYEYTTYEDAENALINKLIELIKQKYERKIN
jgi:hypothetical protein